MKPYVVQTPKFVQRLYPKRIWTFPEAKDRVYLTFDDGPIPEVTPWVLDLLARNGARATFFCIGDNVKKHPDLFRRIISEGHAIGNHTYNHLKGSKTVTSVYIDNVLKAQEEMDVYNDGSRKSKVGSRKRLILDEDSNLKSSIVDSKSLFRPPYGKMTARQAKILQKKGYKIVMWDVLSADFDPSISEEKCLENVLGAIAPGSIVVFHDSLKAKTNLTYVLPKILKFLNEQNLQSMAIELQD